MLNKYSKYVGIPFKDYGRDPVKNGGVDCYGLVSYILKNEFSINVNLYEDLSYIEDNPQKTADNIIKISQNKTEWVDISLDEVKEGDVILMKLQGLPVHLGLALNNIEMIHVFQGANTVIENFRNHKWRHRIWGVKRAVVS